MTLQLLEPLHWPRPKGYASGVSTRDRQVFVVGMFGWDAK